jgi:hypothetical protein
LGKLFQWSQSTISKIAKNKEAILREAEANVMGSRKRKRSGKDDEVDAALYTWFVDAWARDAPITSAVLEEKANHFAVLLNKPEFRCTNGWLCRWKIRHGIKFSWGKKGCRWSSTVLPELLEKYSPSDIYNADETGIYYRAVPDGTLAFSTDKLSGSKKESKSSVSKKCGYSTNFSYRFWVFSHSKSASQRIGCNAHAQSCVAECEAGFNSELFC